MEYSNETFKANLLAYKDDDRSGLTLYGGYILAVDEGHIRVEVYRKGRYFYCYLNHLVPWGDPGWVLLFQRSRSQRNNESWVFSP